MHFSHDCRVSSVLVRQPHGRPPRRSSYTSCTLRISERWLLELRSRPSGQPLAVVSAAIWLLAFTKKTLFLEPSKRLLLTILLLCQLSTAWALTKFENIYAIPAGDLTPIADEIVTSRFEESLFSSGQKYLYLKELQQRLYSFKPQHKDNPLFWFLTGLSQSNLAEVRYVTLLSQQDQKTAEQDITISNHNITRSRAYEKAISLDEAKPHRLSSTIYATMGYGLSNKQKIKTYSRELEIGIASENESNEWFLHWAKIDALVHDKKLEEAQQALAELQKLLAKKKHGAENYSNIVKQAKSQVKAVTKKAENRKEKQAKKTRAKARVIEQREKKWTWKTWLLVAIGVFTLAFVIVAAIYYQVRKRNHQYLIDN